MTKETYLERLEKLLEGMDPKEKEEAISRLYQLMQYVNVHYVEEQQKVKIYPLPVCLWGNLVIEGKNIKNVLVKEADGVLLNPKTVKLAIPKMKL